MRVTGRQGIWIISALSLVGCATIFPPPAEHVLLQSHPAGAEVSINGEVRGLTPLSVPLSCQPVPVVRMALRGYHPVEHPMPRREGLDGRHGITWPVERCVETLSVVLRPTGGG